jgi:hypothetical protein
MLDNTRNRGSLIRGKSTILREKRCAALRLFLTPKQLFSNFLKALRDSLWFLEIV